MIRYASEEGNDGVILEDYIVRDLDKDAIQKYSKANGLFAKIPWGFKNIPGTS